MIAGITVDGVSGLTVTPPSGWTQIRRTDNSTNLSLLSYYKFAGSSEPSSNYTWTFNSSRRAAGGIMRYSGVAANPIDASSGNTGNGGNRDDLRALSVNTSVDDTALVGFYASDDRTSIDDDDGMNRQFDVANCQQQRSDDHGRRGHGRERRLDREQGRRCGRLGAMGRAS